MFNLLVDSSQAARRRTPGYFLLTVLVYGTIMAAAVVGSILVYRPALADTYQSFAMVAPPPPSAPSGGGSPHHSSNKPGQVVSTTAIPTNESTARVPVSAPNIGSNVSNGGSDPNVPPCTGICNGIGNSNGYDGGSPIDGPAPKRPDAKPTPDPVKNDKPVDRIIKVSEGPLLGKAIHIPVPVYPPLAKGAHVEGSVKVELMLDKTGHVISATAVSGPPLLRGAAQQAARESLFRPTLLGGEPVMVEAVITFNFKLQ